MSDYWESAKKELNAFRRFLCADFPCLAIVHALEKSMWKEDWKRGRNEGMWQQSGVYLIYGNYDAGGKLLYVGKATSTFEKRILNSFFGVTGADSLAVIPFPDGYAFMAHTLEAFLIAQLQPPVNICGLKCYVERLPNVAQ